MKVGSNTSASRVAVASCSSATVSLILPRTTDLTLKAWGDEVSDRPIGRETLFRQHQHDVPNGKFTSPECGGPSYSP